MILFLYHKNFFFTYRQQNLQFKQSLKKKCISLSQKSFLLSLAIGANFKFFDPTYQYHVIQNPRILIVNTIKIKNSIGLNVQRYMNNQNFFPEEKRLSQPDL